ncbi:hypothetical protein BH23ACT10_BH23ACT10_29250 [soil metagenome]
MARSRTDDADPTRVVAAILHDTHRVLAVQRVGHDNWLPPIGDVEPGESVVDAARRHVRRTTGFEVAPTGSIFRSVGNDRPVTIVPCKVRGIGSDIGSEICAMCWLSPADLRSQPRTVWTLSLLVALDAALPPSEPHTYADERVALAG